MSITHNEGMQATKAVTAFDPQQQQDKKQVEERQYDKPEESDVRTSESKPYVVNLTDEAVKRSSDTTESYTGEPKADKSSPLMLKTGTEPAPVNSGKLEFEYVSSTDDAAERAASGESATESPKVSETGKEPETGETESTTSYSTAPGGESMHPVSGAVKQSDEPEELVRPGTIDQPAEKRTTERVDKQDQAEELRKSISVYA